MMKREVTMAGILFTLVMALFFISGCDTNNGPEETSETIGVQASSENECLMDINDYTRGQGRYQVRRANDGRVKVWVPSNLPSGCKVPVVHLANGTGGTCMTYGTILQNLAEYGFVATCYENMNTGQGTQAIEAIKKVMQNHSDIVDPNRIGFMGHSQGGGATMTGLSRGEDQWPNATMSGLAMQPAAGFGNAPMNWAQMSAGLTSPVCMFNGTADTLVLPFYARISWTAMTNPSQFRVWYTATSMDSTHIPTPNNPTREISVPWFRWTLLGDANACEAFKALTDTNRWDLTERHLMPACY